ncbi:MAG: hypothetical protein ACOYOA_10495 [Saprospiraceae bacterium]
MKNIILVAIFWQSCAGVFSQVVCNDVPIRTATATYAAGTVHCSGALTSIVNVINPSTGKTWMDRNLGATQIATSSTDVDAYGDVYQWGRRADGHQCRAAATTTTLSNVDQPANGNFILSPNTVMDWRSPQNDNLWQGVTGVNNPCPSGYRLPTDGEWVAERASWSAATSASAFSSPLKLPMSGYRTGIGGNFNSVGTFGAYWTSSVNSSDALYLYFANSFAGTGIAIRSQGQSVRCIKGAGAAVGSINTITCSAATNIGTLSAGTAASGVSSSVPYTGGNAGTYTGQILSSTGVTGLTATLTAGTFASGSGSLTYTITGTPSGTGTANFAINIGGQSCTLARTVGTGAGTFNCTGSPTTVVNVTNSSTGKIWMDRNLGATQAATSSTDAGAYGDLYQWGRGADGHQCRNSGTTTTLSSSDQPGHANFILAPNSPYDWRSPQNTNLWQGVNGVNNPCPSTYRVPTIAELNSERLSWSSNNSAGAFASPLKLPMAGGRNSGNGVLNLVGSYGLYWSSTVNGTGSFGLDFYSGNAYSGNSTRADGVSVRCLKD